MEKLTHTSNQGRVLSLRTAGFERFSKAKIRLADGEEGRGDGGMKRGATIRTQKHVREKVLTRYCALMRRERGRASAIEKGLLKMWGRGVSALRKLGGPNKKKKATVKKRKGGRRGMEEGKEGIDANRLKLLYWPKGRVKSRSSGVLSGQGIIAFQR